MPTNVLTCFCLNRLFQGIVTPQLQPSIYRWQEYVSLCLTSVSIWAKVQLLSSSEILIVIVGQFSTLVTGGIIMERREFLKGTAAVGLAAGTSAAGVVAAN